MRIEALLFFVFATAFFWASQSNADDRPERAEAANVSKPWYVDLNEATQVAESTGRPLMIVFR